MHNYDILSLAVAYQGEDRRICDIAAVPIMLALDFHGMVESREASRGQDTGRADLRIPEHSDLSGADVRRSEEELHCRSLPQPIEVDHRLERKSQWVEVHR